MVVLPLLGEPDSGRGVESSLSSRTQLSGWLHHFHIVLKKASGGRLENMRIRPGTVVVLGKICSPLLGRPELLWLIEGRCHEEFRVYGHSVLVE